eukprot:2188944-Rhodomonas_salina.1
MPQHALGHVISVTSHYALGHVSAPCCLARMHSVTSQHLAAAGRAVPVDDAGLDEEVDADDDCDGDDERGEEEE